MAEDEDGYGEKKHGWLMWLAVFGIAGLLVLVGRNQWGVQTFDKATFYAGSIILAAFVFVETETWFKNNTPKLVYDGNPGFTSFFAVKDLKKIGRWGIARKGGILAGNVYFTGHDGTIVAPYDSFTGINESIVCSTKVEYVKMEQIPPAVRKYISDNKYPTPIEMGIFTTKQMRSPDVAKMKEEMIQLNTQIAMYEKYLKDIMGVKEDLTDWIKRIGEKESPTTALKKLFFEEKKT